jgi:hypothetical protein
MHRTMNSVTGPFTQIKAFGRYRFTAIEEDAGKAVQAPAGGDMDGTSYRAFLQANVTRENKQGQT